MWWISHEAGRLCLAEGLSEWHLAQEGASLCNVPPLPAEIKQGQVTKILYKKDIFITLGERGKNRWGRSHLLKEHDLILHWGPAALPWGKPRNRQTTVISLCQDKLGYCHWSCRVENKEYQDEIQSMQSKPSLQPRHYLSFSGHTMQLEMTLITTATPWKENEAFSCNLFAGITYYPNSIYPNRKSMYLSSSKQNQWFKKLHLTHHCTESVQFEIKMLGFSTRTTTVTPLSYMIYECNSIS